MGSTWRTSIPLITRGLTVLVVKRRGEVLELRYCTWHIHVLRGHLAVDKTKEHIMSRFYWPCITSDVEKYCKSCDKCQKNAPKANYRNTLIPLPIIETPFEQIVMDLVGPILKISWGHNYILVRSRPINRKGRLIRADFKFIYIFLNTPLFN